MTSLNPPFLSFHSAGVFSIYYKVLIYVVRDGNKVEEATLGEAAVFRNDLALILTDEEAEDTITYAELLKESIKEKEENEDDRED